MGYGTEILRMATEHELVERIKQGHSVPGHKVIERRSKGMHAIRHEFLQRLLHVSTDKMTTSLIVRWHSQPGLVNSRTVVDEFFRLDYYGTPEKVSGMFADLWILCYPEDPDVTQKVHEEIDRMCEEVVKSFQS